MDLKQGYPGIALAARDPDIPAFSYIMFIFLSLRIPHRNV